MTIYIKENLQIGLCSTCLHNRTCTTRKTFRGQILQCEEFDALIAQEYSPKVETTEERQTVQYAWSKGLCMNCDLVSTCSFPKPETGVWHCNEYK